MRKMNLNGMDKCIACFSSAQLSHTFKQFPPKDNDIIIPQGIVVSLSHSVLYNLGVLSEVLGSHSFQNW